MARARYAIVRGKVRPYFNRDRAGEAQWTGYIDGLDNDRVSVPLEFRREIGRSKSREIGILGDSDPGEGGYGNVYVTIPQAVLTL